MGICFCWGIGCLGIGVWMEFWGWDLDCLHGFALRHEEVICIEILRLCLLS